MDKQNEFRGDTNNGIAKPIRRRATGVVNSLNQIMYIMSNIKAFLHLAWVLLLVSSGTLNAQVNNQDTIAAKIVYPKEIENCEPCKRLWFANHQRDVETWKMLTSMWLTEHTYKDKMDLEKVVNSQYPNMQIADWSEVKRLEKKQLGAWINRLGLNPGTIFFIKVNGYLKDDSQNQYCVLYEPSGNIPKDVELLSTIEQSLFLFSTHSVKCPILIRKK